MDGDKEDEEALNSEVNSIIFVENLLFIENNKRKHFFKFHLSME